MKAAPAPVDVECVDELPRARALLDPLRLRILERAGEPRSATEIAGELGLPRQRVNYHVRELARARLLRAAGRRRKRNLWEQRWLATARRYLLAPEILGPVQVDGRSVEDRLSASYLLALSARLQDEVARAARDAAGRGQRLSTLALDAELRFTSADQRARFTEALRDAVAAVVREHASPSVRSDGSDGEGRPYRLVVGCHPVPAPAPPDEEPERPPAQGGPA